MTSADPINVYRIELDDDGSPAVNATVSIKCRSSQLPLWINKKEKPPTLTFFFAVLLSFPILDN